jgi:hypothetical protein
VRHQAQGVGEQADIAGVRVDRVVPVRRRIGPAMSPEIRRNRTPGLPHVVELGGPLRGNAGERVQEHHRWAGAPVLNRELAGGTGDAAAHRTARRRTVRAHGGRSRMMRR